MAARGRASLSRDELFAPDVILTGRAFRRADRLSHAQVALLDALGGCEELRRVLGSAHLT